jgi:hypothetical protein
MSGEISVFLADDNLIVREASALSSKVGDGAGLAVGEQDRVHPLLQARAVADQMQPPAHPLALGAHTRIGQPDRRHEIAAGELGQHSSSTDARSIAPREALFLGIPYHGISAAIDGNHGNGFRLSEPFSTLPHLPPVATGCNRSAP